MKSITRIALFVSLLLCTSFVHSQTYTPMLDSYNEWQLKTCFSGCLKDVYYTDGDTVVQGKTYKILDGFHYISRSFLIREDINTKKVYLLFNNSPTAREQLVYDFSIQVGDTIQMQNPISPFPPNPGNFVCDSIILKPLVDTKLYKHFYFHPLDTIQASAQFAIWVEGVGSLSLINAPGGEPDTNGAGGLSCFFKVGEIHFQLDPTSDPCVAVRFPTNTFNHHIASSNILVNHDLRQLEINGIKSSSHVFIYNLQGQLIHRQNLVKNSINLIDYSNFQTGVILLRIQSENEGYSVHKLFISK